MNTPQVLSPFHLAFPVHNLEKARTFYGDILGCSEGRSSPEWIDFNFYGHQIVAHLAPDECQPTQTSEVDSEQVPVRHFGIVMDMPSWQTLADRLQEQELDFIIEPTIRFKGQPGEQATMFLRDPSGNALEFKAFKDLSSLFAK
ncbi:MAG TPA: VOC family protein [Paenalcaligenes sp.]|nr:VOC family protein [Paenalcaligenes sp.]